MHQNLAIILWQFCYGKISFIVLVPGQQPAELLPSPTTPLGTNSKNSFLSKLEHLSHKFDARFVAPKKFRSIHLLH